MPATILPVLLAVAAATLAAASSGSGGSQEVPEAPPPAVEEPASESQSAESDQAPEPEASPPDSSKSQRQRPPLPPFPEPSRPDLTSGQLAVGMSLYFFMFAVYSVVSLSIVVFVLAPVVTRKKSRWRNPTAQALRWALIGASCTTIGLVAYQADESARRSHYMQRYGFSVFPRPEQSLSDTFWEHFAFDLLATATMIICGFVFALGGVWVIRRRQGRSLRPGPELDAPAESGDA